MKVRRPRRRWEDKVKVDLKSVMVWTGFIRLRIEFSGGLFLT
jgi:hypothetical protein